MMQLFGVFLVCGWSIQILIALQLATTAGNFTALVSPRMQDVEQLSTRNAATQLN